MNIAIFCMGKLGGSTEVAVNLALNLHQEGHDCDLYSYTPTNSQRLRDVGIENLTPKSLNYPLFNQIETDFGFLLVFDKKHKAKPYDLIHIHYAVPLVHILANLRVIYQLPCVLTFHGSDVTLMPDLLDVKLISRLMDRSVSAITVASEFLARESARVYEIAPEKIAVIPNTMDQHFFNCPVLENQKEERPYFMHCSNMRPVKRTWDIIKALCCLRTLYEEQGRTDIPRLKLVGEGPDLPEIHLQVQKCKLGDQVDFVGRVDDRSEMARLMAGAKALVLSSLTESQPLVALEAMAVGTPVICSDFEAALEIIGPNEQRGYIFPIGESARLAEKMFYLLENPGDTQRRAEAGQKFALEEHHPEQVTRAYLDLYAGLLP